MRAIWSGSISFGLVNIPVRLYSASKERALKFRMLAKDDLCPISYKKVCRDDNKVVPYEDIVKGYEYEKDEYVVLSDEDFKKAFAKRTELIDIVSFVDEDNIDSKLYDKPYYIEPLKKSSKAYVLLRDALQKSGKVGIAKFVMRDKEHLAVVRPDSSSILILDQLRFKEELRDTEDINVPSKADYSKKELDLALSLIENLSEEFDVKDYKDTFTAELRKIIEAKAKGKLKHIETKEEKLEPTDVADIMDALRRSLKEEKAGAAK